MRATMRFCLVDAVAYSEHEGLIRCNNGAKPVERSELECLLW
jgi:hypothetical protein